jgi:hypothetical protein
MAGDWIAMRLDLGTDPAVIGIAAQVGLDEFAVVGRLHAFWSWASLQTANGHAACVTEQWVDRYLATPGFAAALIKAGWLRSRSGGIEIPNFDHWMSESAKKRLQNALRQRKHRKQGHQLAAENHSEISAHRERDTVTKLSRGERDKNITRERVEESKSKEGKPPLPPAGGNGTKPPPASTHDPGQPIPAAIDTPEVRAAWEEWCAERRARRKPITPRAATLQLEALAPLTPGQVVECIRTSIANGWQGLFPERLTAESGPARGRVTHAATKAEAQDAYMLRMMRDCLPTTPGDPK